MSFHSYLSKLYLLYFGVTCLLQETARKKGFLGVEWWSQQRDSMDPKEYHMDTAITWCRDNGWPDELLSNCHFYPAIGSVVYLTDEGGPTGDFYHHISFLLDICMYNRNIYEFMRIQLFSIRPQDIMVWILFCHRKWLLYSPNETG